MHLFFGALVTESNSFSNIPTSRRSFVELSGRDALEKDFLLSDVVRRFALRAPIARRTLWVGTAGALNADFRRLPYQVFGRRYFPRDEDARA